MSFSRCFLFGLAIASLGLHSAQAVIVVQDELITAPEGGTVHDPVTFDWVGVHGLTGPSGSDLLEGTDPSSSVGNFANDSAGGLTVLTDGDDSTVYNEGGPGGDEIDNAAYATAGNAGGLGAELTYSFSEFTDITNIVVFGGWSDAGRDAQNFQILTSANNGATFAPLTQVNNDPGSGVAAPNGWRTEFSEDTEDFLAEGVTDVKFVFNTFSHENGWTGYSEIDIFGTTTPFLGDANGDQVVDYLDFVIISDNYLTEQPTGTNGDVAKDGFVDKFDFRLWKDNATPQALAQFYGTAAPEPSSLLVAIAFGACGLVLRRRN